MKALAFIKKYVPIWVFIAVTVLAVSGIFALVAPYNNEFSDTVNDYIATPLRVIMSALTYALPLSLFEILLILLIPLLILGIILIIRDKRGAAARIRTVVSLAGVLGIIYSGYLLVMAVPYHTTPLAEKLGIENVSTVEKEDLYDATVFVRDQVNFLSDKVEREGGIATFGGSYLEMSNKLSEAYATVTERHPIFHNFRTRAKPVMFSNIMSDMGIGGIYTYFTGEANVNTAYPDYCTVYTAAHEFAHQRGINREEEANFMAFLATSASNDPFLQYSAYLNMYEYLASALYSADPELYREVHTELSPLAKADIAAANEVTRAHRDSFLYKLMHNVNDTYLKANGTDGVVSYGYVVRIAVAYFNK